MQTCQYHIWMYTEIGIREGILYLVRNQDQASGWLEILSQREAFTGSFCSESQCELYGCMRSRGQKIEFKASCQLQGTQLEMQLRTESAVFRITGKCDL